MKLDQADIDRIADVLSRAKWKQPQSTDPLQVSVWNETGFTQVVDPADAWLMVNARTIIGNLMRERASASISKPRIIVGNGPFVADAALLGSPDDEIGVMFRKCVAALIEKAREKP